MLECEDCDLPTEVLVLWIADSTVEHLCVTCLIRRLLPVMAAAVADTPESAAVPA